MTITLLHRDNAMTEVFECVCVEWVGTYMREKIGGDKSSGENLNSFLIVVRMNTKLK